MRWDEMKQRQARTRVGGVGSVADGAHKRPYRRLELLLKLAVPHEMHRDRVVHDGAVVVVGQHGSYQPPPITPTAAAAAAAPTDTTAAAAPITLIYLPLRHGFNVSRQNVSVRVCFMIRGDGALGGVVKGRESQKVRPGGDLAGLSMGLNPLLLQFLLLLLLLLLRTVAVEELIIEVVVVQNAVLARG